jgi:homoserine dehydrogenase
MSTNTKINRRSRTTLAQLSVTQPRTIGVGLFGCGTVGTAVAEIIAARNSWLQSTHGITLDVRHIVVRDPVKDRAPSIDRALLRDQVLPALRDNNVQLVVEVIGGIDVAGEIVLSALESGKHVVTANKALLAKYGQQLENTAQANDVLLRYEASAGGAIPILQTLRTALPGSAITRLRGVLNGTTNYILTRMTEDGLPFFRALAKAQALGFAEADPRADVLGIDAAQKLIILVRQAFGIWLPEAAVNCTGIDHISLIDIANARTEHRTIRSVAEATVENGAVTLSVKPVALPNADALANVRNEFNALEIEADFAGPLFLQGRGAGGRATASAVFADIVEAATLLR